MNLSRLLQALPRPRTHTYEHFSVDRCGSKLDSVCVCVGGVGWLSWRSAWQKPGVCIGVSDFLPEALIRQFIFPLAFFFFFFFLFTSSSGTGATFSVGLRCRSRSGPRRRTEPEPPGPVGRRLAFHVRREGTRPGRGRQDQMITVW